MDAEGFLKRGRNAVLSELSVTSPLRLRESSPAALGAPWVPLGPASSTATAAGTPGALRTSSMHVSISSETKGALQREKEGTAAQDGGYKSRQYNCTTYLQQLNRL